MRAAASRGLTHLAITDHERIDGALRARDPAPDGLDVIVGQEVRTHRRRPHRAVPGAADPARPDARRGRARDPRAGRPGRAWPTRSTGFARAPGGTGWETELEQLTAAARLRRGLERAAVRRRRQRPGRRVRRSSTACPAWPSSDAHTVMEVGVAYTILAGPIDARPSCARLLPRVPQLVTGRGSRLVRLAHAGGQARRSACAATAG